MNQTLKAAALSLFLVIFLVVLTGCQSRETTPTETVEQIVYVTPSPQPVLSETAAGILNGVETSQLVVSIIFEGYADDAVLEAICDTLEEYDLDGLFFVDGNTAY